MNFLIILTTLLCLEILPLAQVNCALESARLELPSVIRLSPTASVQGTIHSSRNGFPYAAFRGIPYAKVFRRFEAPVKVDLEGLFQATDYRDPCPQKDTLTGNVVGSEDCLNLNVFTPNVSSNLPVIVMIEGGSFNKAFSARSGPDYFMETRRIVLVTFNYRVGAFGFLATDDCKVPGNGGLKDQLEVLRWVHKHIINFGGDTQRVTLLGQSAGGSSVTLHLISPLSYGLFSRAISMSGSFLTPRHFKRNLMKPRTVLLGQRLGCNVSEADELVNCLRDKTVEEILNNQNDIGDVLHKEETTFAPTFEPLWCPESTTFLTSNPLLHSVFKYGYFARIPLLHMVTKDEGLLSYSALINKTPSLLKSLGTNWYQLAPIAFHYSELGLSTLAKEKISRDILGFYFGNKTTNIGGENLTALYSDSFIMSAVHRHALLHAQYAPVYTGIIGHQGPWSFIMPRYGYAKPIGVAHADDLQYIFNYKDFPEFPANSTERAFSVTLLKTIVSFAYNGQPTIAKPWRPLSTTGIGGREIRWQVILPVRDVVVINPYRERLHFWDQIQTIIDSETESY